MPVTPFRFGAGILLKGAVLRRFSLSAFVLSQVLIDCETAYYMLLKQEWPFHRWAHTLLGGLLLGIVAAGMVVVGLKVTPRWIRSLWRGPDLREGAVWPSVAGGVIGGLSHSVLDGIMHRDVQPFVPWTTANPFLSVVSLTTLHFGLVIAGVLGALWITLEVSRLTVDESGFEI